MTTLVFRARNQSDAARFFEAWKPYAHDRPGAPWAQMSFFEPVYGGYLCQAHITRSGGACWESETCGFGWLAVLQAQRATQRES